MKKKKSKKELDRAAMTKKLDRLVERVQEDWGQDSFFGIPWTQALAYGVTQGVKFGRRAK